MAKQTKSTHVRGEVKYINPDGLPKNPAFTNVVTVTGPVQTVYIGGQDAVDATGAIVGKGDLKAQTEQILKNIQAALAAGGAQPAARVRPWLRNRDRPAVGAPARPCRRFRPRAGSRQRRGY